MPDFPTGEQMRAIVAEVAAFHANSKYSPETWQVKRVEYLTDLPVECYHVIYAHGGSAVFSREHSRLTPVGTWTYEAADNFEDTHHKSAQQTSTPESEAAHG